MVVNWSASLLHLIRQAVLLLLLLRPCHFSLTKVARRGGYGKLVQRELEGRQLVDYGGPVGVGGLQSYGSGFPHNSCMGLKRWV